MVIDLSKKNNNRNLFQIIGIGLILFACAICISNFLPKPKTKYKDRLTPQENKIVALIEEGKTNKEIAAEIHVSISTIKTHINNIYKKMNVKSRVELLQIS